MPTASGAGILTGITDLVGGQGYSIATTVEVVDDNGLGPGFGAIPVLTIVDGVITDVSFSAGGQDYTYPALVFNDPENTGSGASAVVTMDNSTMFVASAPVFALTDVGSVIRAGFGVAEITQFIDNQHVIANIRSPIAQIKTDDLVAGEPIKFVSGTWTMTQPISTLYLPALAGFTITGLADGQIIPPIVVPLNGVVTLAQPASAIIVGLAFEAQLQSVYLDTGEPTTQGQRKRVSEVTARIEASAAFEIGSNQPDGSMQQPPQLAPPWNNMTPAPTRARAPFGSLIAPLFSGDIRIPVFGEFDTPGQVAVRQRNPLPLQVLAFVPEVLGGDKPAQEAPKREKEKQ